jgi:hypothetical protein
VWNQKAAQAKLPRPGFVPPLLYSIAKSSSASFLDITIGSNVVFDTVSCCKATKGYDMAAGLGSPIADQVVEHLHH